MKKLLFLLLMFSTSLFAQKTVTKFLGIPVDGFKKEMIHKLEAKGFEYHDDHKYLSGEFNGRDVNIFIATNNNKVYRLMIADADGLDKTQIKIRFNNLCSQFRNNGKYLSLLDEDPEIPMDEDLSYELALHKKSYQAVYGQNVVNVRDSIAMQNLGAQRGLEYIKRNYGVDLKEYGMNWANLDSITARKFLRDAFNLTPDSIANMNVETVDSIMKVKETEFKTKVAANLLLEMYQEMKMRQVWFTISEFGGEYYIHMFYDNMYNKANGEDL